MFFESLLSSSLSYLIILTCNLNEVRKMINGLLTVPANDADFSALEKASMSVSKASMDRKSPKAIYRLISSQIILYNNISIFEL